jgi:chromosome partitioning protein
MAFDQDRPELRSAHVIVVANEKGGTGKSTVSIHLTVALLKAGYQVASIDLDTRQRTMTRFFENRDSWGRSVGHPVELPFHRAPERGSSKSVAENEQREFADFADAVGNVEHKFEFLVIDTPASDSYLMRLAHSLADTLVSPVNDSFIDVDVFSRVHHDRNQRGMMAHYADLVVEARRRRRQADAGIIDWVLARNRVASIQSNNARQVAASLARLATELRFRVTEGLHDRVIFRELFPIGLTALDAIEEASRTGTLTASQAAAREEVLALVDALQLPSRAESASYLDARHAWFRRISAIYDAMEAGRAR